MNNSIAGEKLMKTLLIGLSATVLGVWFLELNATTFPPDSSIPWIAR